MLANALPVKEQYRNPQSPVASERWIAVHVHQGYRGDLCAPAQGIKLEQQAIAQLAIRTREEDQPRRRGPGGQRRVPPATRPGGPRPSRSEPAMARTVAGGTSPIAVTL